MENFWIMKHSDNMNLLNKKSELITKCQHWNLVFLVSGVNTKCYPSKPMLFAGRS